MPHHCTGYVPAEDLLLANHSMGAHLRDTLLTLPGSEWEPEEYLALIQQLDDEGLDDFTRVRQLLLLGIANGKDNAWYTLRIGELKSMLALAGGGRDQALIWTEWTQDFNTSVWSQARRQLLSLPADFEVRPEAQRKHCSNRLPTDLNSIAAFLPLELFRV